MGRAAVEGRESRMLARLRAHLTYANAMATIAVFIALGGGAYALSRGEVKSRNIASDAVKARHIDFGVRSQVMLANFTGLGMGTGDANMAPVGVSAVGGGTFNEMLTPQTFVATGLQVRLDGPLAAGTREFILRYFDYDLNQHVVTDLRCDVGVAEATCGSNEHARIPAGSSVWFEAEHTGTSETDYAEVGWRAVLP
jgi:hypothetical protein